MYIYKAAVIGAGTMGAQIAQTISYSGLPVILKDVRPESVERGLAMVRKIYQGRVEKGKMTAHDMDQKMALVSGAVDYSGFKDVDLVIEAVFEDAGVKRRVPKARFWPPTPRRCPFPRWRRGSSGRRRWWGSIFSIRRTS